MYNNYYINNNNNCYCYYKLPKVSVISCKLNESLETFVDLMPMVLYLIMYDYLIIFMIKKMFILLAIEILLKNYYSRRLHNTTENTIIYKLK